MQKKSIIIVSLLIFSIFSFAFTGVRATNGDLLDFTYSNKLSVGTELSWQLTKFDVSPEEIREESEIEIIPGHTLQLDDVFKIVITADPNTLSITDYSDIFSILNQTWAEYYINDVLIGTNDVVLFSGAIYTMGFILPYILPTTLEFATGLKNTFEYLNEELEVNETSSSTFKYDVKLDDNNLIIKEEMHVHYESLFGGSSDADSNLEYVYDINWGILSKLDIEVSSSSSSDDTSAHWVIESTVEGVIIPAPFNWFYGMIGILILGLAYVAKRK